ncbi:MAG: hypothetical protein HY396_01570 [Candidatus Doudnabacteria bacterium]|nr:hypothetical protein [Candidatus Doudnabacteria bacterium]
MQVHAVLDRLNGETGVEAILAGSEIEPVKYGDGTLGQYEEFRNKLPEGVWEGVLADQLELVMEGPTKVVVRTKEQLLVDTDGRFVFRNIRQVGQPNWAYGFGRAIHPSYTEALERLEHAFQRRIGVSAADFERRAESKKAEIVNNPLFVNLFLGQHARPFAIALPQMTVPEKGGLGELLARTIIRAAKLGYVRQYPERQFKDHSDTLIGEVESFPGSRQERFIEALRQGPVVAWIFMNCLQGGSINAARELIKTLPEEYMLGGTLVNAPVVAAYPEIAAASVRNPLYFCAADVFRRGFSLYLLPHGGSVGFDGWAVLGDCDGHCSASVAVLA